MHRWVMLRGWGEGVMFRWGKVSMRRGVMLRGRGRGRGMRWGVMFREQNVCSFKSLHA